MYCNSCGSNVPVAYKVCPSCGNPVGVSGANKYPGQISQEDLNDIKSRPFVPDYYDEVQKPTKTRTISTELNWDFRFHELIAKYLIWIFILVNFFWGIFFTFGKFDFEEPRNVMFIPKYVNALVVGIHGVEAEAQYPITVCLRAFGVSLIIGTLVMILSVNPMRNRKLGAPQGFISALEFLIVAKGLAAVVASNLSSNPLWLLSIFVFLATFDIVILCISIPYYKTRMHAFR